MGNSDIPKTIDAPPDWEELDLTGLAGPLMVVGASDTGKSTFARYLYHRLLVLHPHVGFLDGDVGQASLGPPTTMTLVAGRADGAGFPPTGPRERFFVGDTSPRGHLLPTVIGAHKLARRAAARGAAVTVYDTTGLVDRTQAGGVLKQALVDLLEPAALFALQREDELEHVLAPLRHSARTRVVEVPMSGSVKRRSFAQRRAHRHEQYRAYFRAANRLVVDWSSLAVFPAPSFRRNLLVALEDVAGLALALGIVTEEHRARRTIVLHTPARALEGVDALRLGYVELNPESCEEL